ncbi:unnamed protein product [Meloidogyne enterolobii]|uniref:Uncharacterized protein n=1 Tax=Meloidogyne enterolobii TaxID=390850 RepID=A0ACB1AV51_MELEN
MSVKSESSSSDTVEVNSVGSVENQSGPFTDEQMQMEIKCKTTDGGIVNVSVSHLLQSSVFKDMYKDTDWKPEDEFPVNTEEKVFSKISLILKLKLIQLHDSANLLLFQNMRTTSLRTSVLRRLVIILRLPTIWTLNRCIILVARLWLLLLEVRHQKSFENFFVLRTT